MELVQKSTSEEAKKFQPIWGVINFSTQKLTRFKFGFEIWHVIQNLNKNVTSCSLCESISDVFKWLWPKNCVFWQTTKIKKCENAVFTFFSSSERDSLCTRFWSKTWNVVGSFIQSLSCCDFYWPLSETKNIWDQLRCTLQYLFRNLISTVIQVLDKKYACKHQINSKNPSLSASHNTSLSKR